ncbi:MAG: hypothetical protein AAF799_11670 [Myxococcota bacterium]
MFVGLTQLSLAACNSAGTDSSPLDDIGGTGEEATSSVAPEDSGGPVDPTEATTTGDGASTEQPASDIRVALVEVNQGVAIPIARDQAWVGPADRNSPLVGGRDTLLRVSWELDPNAWTPRPIEARLTLTDAADDTIVRSQVLDIDGPAELGRLDGAFYFDIAADLAQPGLEFQVALFEAEERAGYEPPATPPVAPAEGPAQIGFESNEMRLRVHVVPLEAAWSGCSGLPDTGAEVMGAFEESLMQRNPATAVELTVATSPIVLTERPSTLWSTFSPLQQRRLDDGASPNQYYYGFLYACGATDIDGAGGMAFGTPPPTEDLAYQRVASGLYLPWDLPWSYTTFVHEIGHLQGLAHVACEQPAPNANPQYPYDNGAIGVWGFGIRDFGLRNPNYARDYMSYCYDDNWVSDWTWWHTFDQIRELSSWDAEAPVDTGRVLVGVRQGAHERWWVTEGSVPGPRLRGLTLEANAETGLVELPVTRHSMSDSDAQTLLIGLPDGISLQGLVLRDDTGRRRSVVPEGLADLTTP